MIDRSRKNVETTSVVRLSGQSKIILQNYAFGGVPAAEDGGLSNNVILKSFGELLRNQRLLLLHNCFREMLMIEFHDEIA